MDRPPVSNASELIPAILEICPRFAARWQQYRSWTTEDAGAYNDLAQAAHFIVESARAGDTDGFAVLFAWIEQLIESGSPDLREYVVWGLLEDVQTISSHSFSDDAWIKRWLGPRTLIAWNDIARAWEGKASLMDVVRAETRRGGSKK